MFEPHIAIIKHIVQNCRWKWLLLAYYKI